MSEKQPANVGGLGDSEEFKEALGKYTPEQQALILKTFEKGRGPTRELYEAAAGWATKDQLQHLHELYQGVGSPTFESSVYDETPTPSPGPTVNPEYFRPEVFQFVKKLGKGAFGTVALSKVKKATNSRLTVGAEVAIKHQYEIFRDPRLTKRVIREIRICRLLGGHDNLLGLLDLSISIGREVETRKRYKTFRGISMVMEYFAGGTLKDHFRNTRLHYSDDDIKSIMTQCLAGLRYMHSANFVHRDLKPENILVRRNTDGPYTWKVVIADFGLAKCFGRHIDDTTHLTTEQILSEDHDWEDFLTSDYTRTYEIKAHVHTKHVVTRYYRAPEVSLLQQEHEELTKIDIWSLGCIFGEIMQMKAENEPRSVLFTGRYDLTLEQDERAAQMGKYTRTEQVKIIESQQINQIFTLLGYPDDKYINSIKHKKLRGWIRQQTQKKARDLTKIYPSMSKEGLDLFTKMLQYDPTQRITAEQCLAHPFLHETAGSGIYNTKTTKPMVENFELAQRMTDAQMRALVCQEIMFYNPDNPELIAETQDEEAASPFLGLPKMFETQRSIPVEEEEEVAGVNVSAYTPEQPKKPEK